MSDLPSQKRLRLASAEGAGGTSRSTAEELLRERFAGGVLSGEQSDEAKRRLVRQLERMGLQVTLQPAA